MFDLGPCVRLVCYTKYAILFKKDTIIIIIYSLEHKVSHKKKRKKKKEKLYHKFPPDDVRVMPLFP